MTKDELIALAKEGKASIELAYTVTRYCVTPRGIDVEGERLEYPVIFASLNNEDGQVFEDTEYYTDGVDESDLTDDEVEVLRKASGQRFARKSDPRCALSCNSARIQSSATATPFGAMSTRRVDFQDRCVLLFRCAFAILRATTAREVFG